MKLYFSYPQNIEALARPVISLLKSYCRNYAINWVENIHQADSVIFYGKSFEVPKPSCFIPCIEQHRVPQRSKLNLKNSLPLPDHTNFYKDKEQLLFTGDLLQFLVGQLYRAEEYLPQHKKTSLEGLSTGYLGDQFGFFDRPVVDLWIGVIFNFLFSNQNNQQKITSIWAQNGPSVWLTHDVDVLLKWTWRRSLFQLALLPVDLFNQNGRSEIKSMFDSWFKYKDPRDCLEKIMDIEHPLKSTFFFLGWPKDHLNRRYNLLASRFAKSLLNVKMRKWEYGLHGSPLHIGKPEFLAEEAHRFETLFKEKPKYTRQHFLMWDILATPQKHFHMDIKIDSTLGFNDRSGYRCGTAMPFLWFDLNSNTELDLLEVPLIAADHQIHPILAQGKEKSLAHLASLFETSSKAQGIHTSLFHNMYFSGIEYPEFSELYQNWLIHLKTKKCQFLKASEIRNKYLANEPKN